MLLHKMREAGIELMGMAICFRLIDYFLWLHYATSPTPRISPVSLHPTKAFQSHDATHDVYRIATASGLFYMRGLSFATSSFHFKRGLIYSRCHHCAACCWSPDVAIHAAYQVDYSSFISLSLIPALLDLYQAQ